MDKFKVFPEKTITEPSGFKGFLALGTQFPGCLPLRL
jgi:hypothetical protein